MIFRNIYLYLFIAWGHMSLFAQGQAVRVAAFPDTAAILIGDQTRIRLRATVPQGAEVAFPAVGDTITTPIEVLKASEVLRTELPDGQIQFEQDLTVTSFQEGYHAVPPFDLLVKLGAAPAPDTFRTEAFLLEVQTVAVDTTQAIRDIKQPFEAPLTFAEMLPYILGGLVVLALLGAGIWYWRKRQRQPKPVYVAPKPAEPAHVVALRELEQLEGKQLWQNGQYKAYQSEVTDIVRLYIERQFELPAMEYTSDEILSRLQLRKVPFEQREWLQQLLSVADLVKFAKYHPLPDENTRALELARRFVQATTQREEVGA